MYECPKSSVEEQYTATFTNQRQRFSVHASCIEMSQRIWDLLQFCIRLEELFLTRDVFAPRDESSQPIATNPHQLDVTPISSLSLQEQPDLFIWYYDRRHWNDIELNDTGGQQRRQKWHAVNPVLLQQYIKKNLRERSVKVRLVCKWDGDKRNGPESNSYEQRRIQIVWYIYVQHELRFGICYVLSVMSNISTPGLCLFDQKPSKNYNAFDNYFYFIIV